jgi:hypothetical protein
MKNNGIGPRSEHVGILSVSNDMVENGEFEVGHRPGKFITPMQLSRFMRIRCTTGISCRQITDRTGGCQHCIEVRDNEHKTADSDENGESRSIVNGTESSAIVMERTAAR